MAKSAELVKLDGYDIKEVQAEDQPGLQDLLVRCSDYFTMVSGSAPGPTAALSLLESRPEGVASEEKVDLAVYAQAGEIIAVIDAVRNYPVQGAWWLGLLLIDPAYRNMGLGRRIYEAFESWSLALECQGMCLGVIDANQSAYRFWRLMGFEEFERQPPRQFGALQHTVITMVKRFS
jgi:GNAT superfamily N-acetyltransferase